MSRTQEMPAYKAIYSFSRENWRGGEQMEAGISIGCELPLRRPFPSPLPSLYLPYVYF